MNSLLFAATRHASVAITRERFTRRRFILSEQTLSASIVRSMASGESCPRTAYPLAQPDNPGERVDHVEAAPRGDGRREGDNCLFQDQGRHRPADASPRPVFSGVFQPGLPDPEPPCSHVAPKEMFPIIGTRTGTTPSVGVIARTFPVRAVPWQPRVHRRSAQSLPLSRACSP